ncbi:carboxylesterase family protein [Cupriavidus basilensis]|uniref:carboxylesterase family protein n=1 Tax=Cupriavidus basilensis TaxID=68895 RepID=UPI00157A59F6|nr:carboxylesterase family protein [Cupriavidus basilensis]NUA27183.1 carboxylesterase/lipase family protein [Cupriavidus basilensis]
MHVKEKSVVVSLSIGAIRGEASDGVFAFRGVPYGERAHPGSRLSEVKPPSAWTGERDASALGAVFPQSRSRLATVMGNGIDRNPQSEDAFLLNVWAPRDAERRPVFVFLHGGGFLSGGGTAAWYDGERIARESGMVVVTVNYRLGALGNFIDASDARGANRGNRSVRDLIRSLEWVQEHISRFGGDPARVTVGGQSAGAYYAWLLGVSPASKGLLHQNAMFSLPALPPLSPDDAYRKSLALLDAAGAQDIGALSVDDILAAQGQLMRARAGFGEVSIGFRPVAEDGLVPDWLFDLPRAAKQAHVSSSLLGFAADENAAFMAAAPEVVQATESQAKAWFDTKFGTDAMKYYAAFAAARPAHTPYTQIVDASGYKLFGELAREIASAFSAAGKPLYPYRFHVQSRVPNLMSPHCLELPFLFGNRGDWLDAPMIANIPDETFEKAGFAFRSAIASFATTGKPATLSAAAWQAFDSAEPGIAEFEEGGCSWVPWHPLLAA